MKHLLKTNLTLPDSLTRNVRAFALENNYIRITDAIRYLIGSGLHRERDRGTFLSVSTASATSSKGEAA